MSGDIQLQWVICMQTCKSAAFGYKCYAPGMAQRSTDGVQYEAHRRLLVEQS